MSEEKKIGGIQAALDALSGLSRENRQRIIAEIALKDPNIAREIKKHMFQFEDLATMQPNDFNKLYNACDKKKFYLALRNISDDFKDQLSKLVSRRAFQMIFDDVEALGPQKLSEVEAAQNEIIALAKKMAEEGKIALPDKWSGDKIVA